MRTFEMSTNISVSAQLHFVIRKNANLKTGVPSWHPPSTAKVKTHCDAKGCAECEASGMLTCCWCDYIKLKTRQNPPMMLQIGYDWLWREDGGVKTGKEPGWAGWGLGGAVLILASYQITWSARWSLCDSPSSLHLRVVHLPVYIYLNY